MEKIYESAEALIGHTPLLRLSRIEKELGVCGALIAKLERQSIGGSAKDRVARAMLDAAEREGRLRPGGTVIEPTSGNTGVGLAMLCAVRGYRAVIVMPEGMSEERIKLISTYGARVVLTPRERGMAGAVEYAKRLAAETENSFLPDQFANSENPYAHYATTGPEIWQDADGRIDAFVCGVGTGGTLSGVGRYLKEQSPSITVVGVEPAASPLISEGHAGAHAIQGIGANFLPKNYDGEIADRIITVTDAEALEFTRLLARLEGLLVGISSGAALCASAKLSSELPSGARIVALLPDTGERYLSVL